jgi:Glycosyl transferase family 2
MSDVTAVVLSLGEPYTDRALSSLRRQTVPPAEVIMVSGEVRPFHRAINTGAERARTPFFVQVDADMILDPSCLEEMRAAMSDDAGMIAGQLRDPLLGPILGVRLYRRGCFRDVAVPNSIAPISAFERELERRGWSWLCALRPANGRATRGHSFGEHRPDYNVRYTFAKFTLGGARNRYRKSGDRLRSVFDRLRGSPHPAAPVARIATAHGIFARDWTDQLGRPESDAELNGFAEFLQSSGAQPSASETIAKALRGDLRTAFGTSVAVGIALRKRDAYPTVLECMEMLSMQCEEVAWVATIGLCHGLFLERAAFDRIEEDFDWLQPLLCPS